MAIDDQRLERVPLFQCILMSRSGTTDGNAVAVVINDNIGRQCRGKRRTKDGPFTKALANICQNPPLWLYFFLKCNLNISLAAIDSAFKGMEQGLTLSADLCSYDENTGRLQLPDNINSNDLVVDRTTALFETVGLGEDDMYSDQETPSAQSKSSSKSKGSGKHSDASKDPTGSNKSQSSLPEQGEEEKHDAARLSDIIAGKEKVDKKEKEGQTASKLRGSRSWKTTESAKKERLAERRLRIDHPEEPPKYGADGVSIRNNASTLTSGGGSNKSTAPQNIEYSYRKKSADVLTLQAEKGELAADNAVLVREKAANEAESARKLAVLEAEKAEMIREKAELARASEKDKRDFEDMKRRMAAMEAGEGSVDVSHTAPAPSPSALAPKLTATPETCKASTKEATLHLSEEKRSVRFSNSDKTRGSRAQFIPPKELEKIFSPPVTETNADDAHHPAEAIPGNSGHGTTDVESAGRTRRVPKSKKDTKVSDKRWTKVQRKGQLGQHNKEDSVSQAHRKKTKRKHKSRKKSELVRTDDFSPSADESGVESVTHRVDRRPSRLKTKDDHVKVTPKRPPGKKPPKP